MRLDLSLSLTIPGKPQPKERPRFFRGHAVTPAKTRRYEKLVHDIASDAVSQFNGWPLDASYYFAVSIYWADRRRHDATNVLKSIEDGCNGVVWNDDSQIVAGEFKTFLDRENPRVEVRIDAIRAH